MADFYHKEIRCAPLKGFTDSLFQTIHKKYYSGINSYMAPFLLSSGDEKGWKGAYREYSKKSLGFHDTIPQILASDRLDEIKLYVRLFRDNGFPEVNINLGCSAGCVMKKNKGAAVLTQPELMDRILDSVCAEFPDYLSLKLRLGISDSKDIFRLIPVINRYPLKSVIIHPRTSHQKYNGTPDMVLFNQSVSCLEHPVFYSGDIFSLADYHSLTRNHLFSGLLLGRGLLGNPALAEEICGDEKLCECERNNRFALFYEEFAGALHNDLGKRAVSRLKAWWFYFSFCFGERRKTFLDYIYNQNDFTSLNTMEKLFPVIYETEY